jgi:DNA-3-methyladenine glycosylase
MTTEPYPRTFFERRPDVVARALIGATIVVRREDRMVSALIVETEAYGGSDDPASHAFRGPTPRCEVMFGPAGFLYVYRSYGIHWCVNVVTGESGTASAVLLRAAAISASSETSLVGDSSSLLLRGPGNLSRGLGLNGTDNRDDCCQREGTRVSFQNGPAAVASDLIGRSARIGISKGQERLSRYFFVGHRAVSGNRVQNAEDK